ncbi:MAG: dihydroneopterin aldolase [Muribaculaceae bacterium]|nr:dihydroneopterin aldolase [Muribaculaceae bacterium]
MKGLRLHGYHGVLEQETRVGNTFVYDLFLTFNWLDAAITDDVERTINYNDVVAIIRSVNNRPARLIETVAYGVYRAIAETYPNIVAGYVRVTKSKPPIAGVEIEGTAVELEW